MLKLFIKTVFLSVISFSAYASDSGSFNPELNLSLKVLRMKYPLKETIFYDLEEKLYTFPTSAEAEVLYNSDLKKLKRGIKNLKALSKGSKNLAKKCSKASFCTGRKYTRGKKWHTSR